MRLTGETLSQTQADYVIRAEGFNAIDTLLAELGLDASAAFSEMGLDVEILQPHHHATRLLLRGCVRGHHA